MIGSDGCAIWGVNEKNGDDCLDSIIDWRNGDKMNDTGPTGETATVWWFSRGSVQSWFGSVMVQSWFGSGSVQPWFSCGSVQSWFRLDSPPCSEPLWHLKTHASTTS